MSTRYVLRLVYNTGRGGSDPYQPIDYTDRDPLYLYRSVSRDRRHGWLVWKVSELDRAREWATRSGAEGYLAEHFTYEPDANGIASRFVVEEVVR